MVKEPRKKKKQKKRLLTGTSPTKETPLVMEILNPNTGAVDIGSTEHFPSLLKPNGGIFCAVRGVNFLHN